MPNPHKQQKILEIHSKEKVIDAMNKFKDELLKDLPNTQIINTFHYWPQNPNDWARADKLAELKKGYYISRSIRSQRWDE